MPVTQQVPGHPRDAKSFGRRSKDLFEQVVGPERPCPTRVQKDPAVFLGLRAPGLKLSELRKLGPCEPDRTTASVRLWRIDFAIVHRLSDP